MNPNVDQYFIDGCGRCELGGTPECKVHSWTEILSVVRQILLNSDLNEERKWGVPCYTLEGKNIAILSALKSKVVLSFFKGALLADPHKLLHKPGENSQADRQFEFTQLNEVQEIELIINDYLNEAIEIEKAGLKIDYNAKNQLNLPEELKVIFAEDEEFKIAFEKLTPGRQRGYCLHFSKPKKSETRISRIKKSRSKILLGKGFQDR